MSEYEENTLNYYDEFICFVSLKFRVSLFPVPRICFYALCMETPFCFMHECSRIMPSKLLGTEEKMWFGTGNLIGFMKYTKGTEMPRGVIFEPSGRRHSNSLLNGYVGAAWIYWNSCLLPCVLCNEEVYFLRNNKNLEREDAFTPTDIYMWESTKWNYMHMEVTAVSFCCCSPHLLPITLFDGMNILVFCVQRNSSYGAEFFLRWNPGVQ
jgi:hypothetical protein